MLHWLFQEEFSSYFAHRKNFLVIYSHGLTQTVFLLMAMLWSSPVLFCSHFHAVNAWLLMSRINPAVTGAQDDFSEGV